MSLSAEPLPPGKLPRGASPAAAAPRPVRTPRIPPGCDVQAHLKAGRDARCECPVLVLPKQTPCALSLSSVQLVRPYGAPHQLRAPARLLMSCVLMSCHSIPILARAWRAGTNNLLVLWPIGTSRPGPGGGEACVRIRCRGPRELFLMGVAPCPCGQPLSYAKKMAWHAAS
jgi:hypothetical protein